MDGEKLISKKELLEVYGISYGALYRWKRKGLIPEDWFIRRATPTGQETFFPEEMIRERVETILSGKNELELDALARRFRGEEEEEWMLLVSASYGEKSYRLKDVKKITLVKGEKTVELTAVIAEAAKEN